MTSATTTDTGRTDDVATGPAIIRTHRRPRRVALLLIAALMLAIPLTTNASPASAESVGSTWLFYDTDRNYRDYELAVWVDAYGRVTSNAWLDANNDGRWDTFASDINNDGNIDQVWYDLNPYNAGWDTLIDLTTSMRYEEQNGTAIGAYYQHSGPFNTWWARAGFFMSTLGPISTYGGTNAGAFNNLVLTLATHSGLAVWFGGVPYRI